MTGSREDGDCLAADPAGGGDDRRLVRGGDVDLSAGRCLDQEGDGGVDQGPRQGEGRWTLGPVNRHTLVTNLSELGAGDEVIMSIAGHVSRSMLSRYTNVRMEAKRRALDENCRAPERGRREAPDGSRAAAG